MFEISFDDDGKYKREVITVKIVFCIVFRKENGGNKISVSIKKYNHDKTRRKR